MPTKPEPIVGEFINEKYQVYRMKNGERGVCVIWRNESEGIRLKIEFNTGQRKTFVSNKPEIISIPMAGIMRKNYPSSFEILTEVPNAN